METGSDGHYCGGMSMRVYSRVQRIKRAAMSGPQDRKNAGPSLAHIGLRVHQLVKISVHL